MSAHASIDLDRMIFAEDFPPIAAPFPLIRSSGRNLVSRASRVARTLRVAADSASDAMKESGDAGESRAERAGEAAGRAFALITRAGELLMRLERAVVLLSKRPALTGATSGSSRTHSPVAEVTHAIIEEASKTLSARVCSPSLLSHSACNGAGMLSDLIAPRLGVLRIRAGNAASAMSRESAAARGVTSDLLAECDALARGAAEALSGARASCKSASDSLAPLVNSAEFAEAERLAADALTRHAPSLELASSVLRGAHRLERSRERLEALLASAERASLTTRAASLRAVSARDAQ